MERSLGKTRGQVWWRGKYVFLDELPVVHVETAGDVPPCDLLCQAFEADLGLQEPRI